MRFTDYNPNIEKHLEISIYRAGENRVATVFNDVTQRKEMEAALRSVLGSIAEGYILYDKDWRVLEINPRAQQEFFPDRSPEQIIGNIVWELYPAAVGGEIHRNLLHAQTSGQEVHFEGYSRSLAHWYELHAFPPGPLIEVYVRDITDRKIGEDRLQAYAGQLERSNRELEEFAFIASHDLQEPLRKIEAFHAQLTERLAGKLDPTEQDYFRRTVSAAQRMRRMIDDLLLLSRATTHPADMRRVDLNEVARSVLEDLEFRLRQSGGQVQVEPLPTVYADPLQMHQLLQNLLGNALKFHPPEGEPQVIVRGLALEDGMTGVEVIDNGIGIDPEHVDRIFQPFQRLNSRQDYESSGIGLAICRRIAERHGGAITVISQAGQGATFKVSLPAR